MVMEQISLKSWDNKHSSAITKQKIGDCKSILFWKIYVPTVMMLKQNDDEQICKAPSSPTEQQ